MALSFRNSKLVKGRAMLRSNPRPVLTGDPLMRRNGWKIRPTRFLIVFLAIQTASCGTLLHPERQGQPAGRLDPAIAVLDAAGLLLFFIPGVIAFAVDFSNGTIYLPPDRSSALSAPEGQRLQTVQVNPKELTSQRLEEVLRQQTGQSVRFEPGTYRATRINQIQDFTPTAINDLKSSAASTSVIFRGTGD